MGFNSTVFICNDAMDQIEKDPAGWWAATNRELVHATFGSGGYDGRPGPKNYGFGNHANAFWAVSNEHADVTVLIAVGGNHPTVLTKVHNGGRHHTPEDQVELLRAAADKLGYDLRKKPQHKHQFDARGECACGETDG